MKLFGKDYFRCYDYICTCVLIMESSAIVQRDLRRHRCRTDPNQRFDFLLCAILFLCMYKQHERVYENEDIGNARLSSSDAVGRDDDDDGIDCRDAGYK